MARAYLTTSSGPTSASCDGARHEQASAGARGGPMAEEALEVLLRALLQGAPLSAGDGWSMNLQSVKFLNHLLVVVFAGSFHLIFYVAEPCPKATSAFLDQSKHGLRECQDIIGG